MQIRQATNSDLGLIMSIISEARKIMQLNGNASQWKNGYPSEANIIEDINKKHGYICKDSEAYVGYFCFIKGTCPDQNYLHIENGKWLNDNPYGVIHRLASNGKCNGIFKTALDFGFSKINNLRIDTHCDNLSMQHLLRKYGFSRCGTIFVGDSSPRDAFQKSL